MKAVVGKLRYRVGYLTNSSEIGGGNRSLEVLARGLKHTQFEPVFVFSSKGPMHDLVKKLNFQVAFHNMSQPDWTRIAETMVGIFRWTRLIQKYRLDIIHANGLHNARSVILAATLLQIPVLCHIRFTTGQDTYKWIFRHLPKPRGFIYISHYMKNRMHPFIKAACPSSEYWVVHNGVNTKLFAPAFTNNDVFRIGVVANLQKIKGHEDVLEMAYLLKKKGVSFRCDFLGTDTLNENRAAFLKSIVTQRGLESYVCFKGHVANVSRHIQGLDMVLCASHEEPFGRCIIEGLACGKPVVATRVGGIPEIIESEEYGIMIPAKNPSAMVEAVEKLIQNKSLRHKMGRRARHRAQNYFSDANHVGQVVEIYKRVLNL